MHGAASTVWFQVAETATEAATRDKPLTFDQPVGDLPIVHDARWSAGVTDSSFTALLAWIVLLVVLQAASWPLVRRLFTRFPDRGWSLARLVTILVAGYAVWLLASIEVIAFRAVWAGVAVLVVAGFSLLVGGRLGGERAGPPFWRNPVIVAGEAVFWTVFALFLLFRAINPDSYHPFWGGEKPMEFAHLNAILRSAHFPPVDPWYSGGYINYYYYGTYLVAFLIKLTGIPVEYAFNLAEPTFVAFLALATFGTGAALGRRLTASTGGAIVTGALSTFLVSIGGNMVVAARVVDRWLNGLGPVDAWTYWVWGPSRTNPSPEVQTNITEFPYFSGLYADLHPHLIALPFTVLIIALAWQLASSWRTTTQVVTRPRLGCRDLWRLILTIALAALGLGSLFMTNAWDLPMYVAVTGVGVVMATKGIRSLWRRLALAGGAVAVIGAVAYALILPFTTHYVALFGEISTVRDRTPLLAVESHLGGQFLLLTAGIAALVATGRGRVARLGGPLLPLGLLAVALMMQWIGRDDDGAVLRIGQVSAVVIVVGVWLMAAWDASEGGADFALPPGVLRSGLVILAVGTMLLLVAERDTLALYAGVGFAAGVLWLALEYPSARFVAALAAGGMLLGASLELLYLVDDLDGSPFYRMNTIFKFYNQIWILLGLAAAALAGRAIWQSIIVDERAGQERARTPFGWTAAVTSLTAAVVVAALAYPVVATPIRLDQRFAEYDSSLTLDAYRWMERGRIQYTDGQWVGYADDLAAIDWLNQEIGGTPVIAEASFGPYRCNGSRFSIATGLPAVIGWVRHEMQQRYIDDLAQREADLRELYASTDIETKQAIIATYDIEYIIVGQTERSYPRDNSCTPTDPSAGIAALEGMVGETLELAFQHGTTTIYRVLPSTR